MVSVSWVDRQRVFEKDGGITRVESKVNNTEAKGKVTETDEVTLLNQQEGG